MTIACVVHWYESLLFLAPVALTVAAIWITSKIAERRELREAADDTQQAADLAAFQGGA
jgi:cytochrome c-type biogenesis protein CcmH/NrfF